MNDLTKQVQLIFVVETNVLVKSDDAYIVWLLKKSYSSFIDKNRCEKLFFTYTFVYMDGKTKYNKASVIRDVNLEKRLFPYGESIVIYCVDLDTCDKQDEEKFEEIKRFTEKNNYYLVAFYKEIEDIFGIDISISKQQKVRYFLEHYPKFSTVKSEYLKIPIENLMGNIGRTNFNLVLDEIIKIKIK